MLSISSPFIIVVLLLLNRHTTSLISEPSFISLSILKKSLSNVTAEDNGCFLKLFKPNNMYNDSSIVVLPEPFSPVNNVSLLSS